VLDVHVGGVVACARGRARGRGGKCEVLGPRKRCERSARARWIPWAAAGASPRFCDHTRTLTGSATDGGPREEGARGVALPKGGTKIAPRRENPRLLGAPRQAPRRGGRPSLAHSPAYFHQYGWAEAATAAAAIERERSIPKVEKVCDKFKNSFFLHWSHARPPPTHPLQKQLAVRVRRAGVSGRARPCSRSEHTLFPLPFPHTR
jgi:hypothetical protein